MYYSEKGPYKRGSGGQTITFENSAVLVHGHMDGNTYHPLLNISVIPQVALCETMARLELNLLVPGPIQVGSLGLEEAVQPAQLPVHGGPGGQPQRQRRQDQQGCRHGLRGRRRDRNLPDHLGHGRLIVLNGLIRTLKRKKISLVMTRSNGVPRL